MEIKTRMFVNYSNARTFKREVDDEIEQHVKDYDIDVQFTTNIINDVIRYNAFLTMKMKQNLKGKLNGLS